uniref:Coatomer subunit gamma n=2 Tax=Hirondellea gigas TaxID=1518452 RepID=A0A6A7FYD8_9CRUS
MSHSKKLEEEEDKLPWIDQIQKSQVLHEAKMFNASPIDPNLCRQIIVEILYLINQGDHLTAEETQDVFFGCTKLFQSTDTSLRRLVYLIVTALNKTPTDAVMVINTLMKDVTGNDSPDLFRGNAVRVLSKIVDSSLLSQIDRHIKQCIVAKDAFLASSALMAGIRLYANNEDIIRRWVNEVQDGVKNSSHMVQYHALHLLHKIKQFDRGALAKVVTALTRKSSLKSPLARCLLIRYIMQVIGNNSSPPRVLTEYLVHSLRHKRCMVMYEAARALCSLRQLPESTIMPATSVLQELLNSAVPSQRFAAVRTLSQLVPHFPNAVTTCQVDLERLQSDSNRNIATLAITTLLKTGGDVSIDRLIKSLSGFIAEIPDELKIELVVAVRMACLKYPDKNTELMSFLSSVLREEGGLEYKRTIVDSIIGLMDEIPSSKDSALEHLCEFIEDCEFPELSIQILHLLGEEAKNTANASKYIRFVFNRIILELPSVRCAAVSSLAKFGSTVPSLARDVCILLRRCLSDNDDEVRDRATYYLQLVADGHSDYLNADIDVRLADLEYSVQLYLQNDTTHPFTIENVVPSQEITEEKMSDDEKSDILTPLPGQKSEDDEKELRSIPEFSAILGSTFGVTKSIELTESESEYVVSYVKYIYANYIIFRFEVINTIDDQILENVSVDLQADDDWTVETTISAAKLDYNKPSHTYASIRRQYGVFSSNPIPAVLKFISKDADSAHLEYEEGIEDEYTLEDIHIRISDFVQPRSYTLVDFKKDWPLHQKDESVARYNYDQESLQDVIDEIISHLGMKAVDETQWVPADVQQYAVSLYGMFCQASEDSSDATNEFPVYARVIAKILQKKDKSSIILKISVRCSDSSVSEMLSQALGS